MSAIVSRAAELKLQFDQRFAAPVSRASEQTEDLLCIRAGRRFCALRLAEVGGVHKDTVIRQVPSRSAFLLGIAGFRGELVPVFDLPALLGEPRDPNYRLLCTANVGGSFALAFSALEKYARVPAASVSTTSGVHLVNGVVNVEGVTQYVLSLLAILASLSSKSGPLP